MEKRNLNTVQTVFTQEVIEQIESAMHKYWNEFNNDCYTDHLMLMLSVYVENCPENVHEFRKPGWMTKFVSECIQMNDQNQETMREAEPWKWEETPDGWRLLETQTQN